MTQPAISEEEFIKLFVEHGAEETAKILGIAVRNVYARRKRIEENKDLIINAPSKQAIDWETMYPKRLPITIENGIVLIGSDAHYWPGIVTTAHRAFCHLAKELKPHSIILNGDGFDAARASRHDRIGWEQTPTLKHEKEAVIDRTHEIVEASPESKLYWTLGNHDLRFESRLSNKVPEYEGIEGFTLRDQFPLWSFAVSIWINNEVVVKHRYKGGTHATHNNTVNAGKTIVTGHLHSLKVTPFDDYNGTRWGVDTGTMIEPCGKDTGGPQVNYNEDNPQNHRSGFIVLTFKDGKLLWPEICRVVSDGVVDFRGNLIRV